MKVLLTRAPDQNARIQQRLADTGIESAVWPLSRICFTDDAVTVPSGAEAILFTSGNGVIGFAARSKRRDIPVYCVGERTAQIAREHGFADVTATGQNVSGMAAFLAKHPQRNFFYPRARDVSVELPDLLPADFRVYEQIVYRAEPAGGPESAVLSDLLEGRIGIVTIWSRRNGTVLANFLSDQHDIAVSGMDLVAISENAAEALGKSGFEHIYIANTPDAEGMLSTIAAAVRQKSCGR